MPKLIKKKNITGSRCCFNPYNFSSHKNKREGLRTVTEQQLRGWNLPVTEQTLQQKVCNTCRMRQTIKKADATESSENKNVCIFYNIIL